MRACSHCARSRAALKKFTNFFPWLKKLICSINAEKIGRLISGNENVIAFQMLK
jgi:hypothetical protein